MGLPFQCLIPLGKGSLFCAAKGCSIHTFDLTASPQLQSSWTHPSSSPSVVANKEPEADDNQEQETGQDQPPSKRRKLDSGANVEAEGNTPASAKKQKKNAGWSAPKAEAPFVVLLTATEDGSHVIAVTGQDKTLWVFEHDGQGGLKELSQRPMPKRPCSLALTADGQTIISADKFGDVYALPLTFTEGEEPAAPAPVPAASTTATAAPVRGANVFTVHSQRNRRALEDQQRQRANNPKLDAPKEGPKFAHDLLLGHVSLLTSVLTTKDAQGRPYIITADRDEHIRVSRGMPQTHVIETYCQGHVSFVNALCVPASRPEILISGGGDTELYVWDWLAGKLLGKTDLLAHARAVLPDVSKIAVVKVLAYEVDGEVYAAVICERVPALFIFLLQTDNALVYRETLELRGRALDVMTLGAALLVSTDPIEGQAEVSIFGRDGENLWMPRGAIENVSDEDQPAVSREDLDKALYTIENLRKTEMDHEGGEEEANPEPAEQGQQDEVMGN